ncbi:inorganic phosphate transporter [Halorubrum sp. AD140]|uniref:inorganic phosphate transporter n=1 Tax=Halorubrum sp. AD140 TaxID=3050073 RepID=UPI002ACC62D9|nr:inorganic phosphate transporter [Halorubrum sp. AD140]MDZ5810757.1 inorganic phosphate transporter [Halorubrum sp. AD140]
MSSTALLVVAFLASVSLSWALGASSTSPPMAPAVGARALSVMRAALLVGVLAAAGAILQGGSVSETVGNDLILGASLTPLAVAVGLLTAAGFIAVGVATSYPIPAAFATTGAVVGVGLALGGDPALETYRELATFWVLVPPTGASIAYLTAAILRREDVPDTLGIPLLGGLVGVVVANVTLSVLPAAGGARPTIARFASRLIGSTPTVAGAYDLAMVVTSLACGVATFLVLRRQARQSVDVAVRRFLIALGGLVAFSSGGSQVGLAIGPLGTLAGESTLLTARTVTLVGATGLLVGGLTGAPRIIQAVANEYSQLGTRRSIAALVPAFVITQTGILLGFPISLNNIIISSVIGSGLVVGTEGISVRKITVTAVAWLSALVGSCLIGYVAFGLASTGI